MPTSFVTPDEICIPIHLSEKGNKDDVSREAQGRKTTETLERQRLGFDKRLTEIETFL